MRNQAGTTEGETPITATLPDHGTEQGWAEWDDWEEEGIPCTETRGQPQVRVGRTTVQAG